jgi:D-hydroxyproline dehydrogenase subunit gamma
VSAREETLDRRLPGHGDVERGESVTILVDGQKTAAHLGETVAGALMGMGKRVFRETFRRGVPRGLYCGMGVCYDCLVVVDGRPNTRACMTYVTDGMEVATQKAWGGAEPDIKGDESAATHQKGSGR